MSRKFALFPILFFLLSFISAPLAAYAQSSTTGAIGGTVSDASGGLLPNVAIKVSNSATGQERTGKTSGSGEFRIPDLEPGVYTATITADGYGTLQQDLITVTVGSVTTLSPKLTIGSALEKVDVSGENNTDVHLSGAEISTTIDQTAIENLPINGRRWSDFALLTPGVVSSSDGFGLLSFRGISYLLNNNTIDGADDNQAYFSEARGRTRAAYTVSQGAVQEFQVNTSNYSAEYGRAAGGVINTVTKSGTNKIHGELFFYDRDNGLGGATNSYTTLTQGNIDTGFYQVPYKPKDWRKQWGFAVGGPILRDRLFWFYAYDQQKRNFPGTGRTTDPTDMLQLAGPLSPNERCLTGGANGFGDVAVNYTDPTGHLNNFGVTDNLATPAATTGATYPIGQYYQGNFGACALAAAINGSTTQTNTPLNYEAAAAYYNQGIGVIASFFGLTPRMGNQVVNFPKLDWQINDRNRLSMQYNRMRWDSPNGLQTQTSNFYGRGSFGNDFVKEDVGVFRVSSVLSNTIVNNFLAQYGRDLETETPSTPTPNEMPLSQPLQTGECSALNNNGCVAAPPSMDLGYGYDGNGFSTGVYYGMTRFALPDERRIQLKDDVTWSHGNHTFKFGLDYNKVSDFIDNLYEGYGDYGFDYSYNFIGSYLNATTGLGGPASTFNGGHGLYSIYDQGTTVPTANGNLSTGASGLIATREYAGYATDDWRILPRLTLTLGVRYEYEYIPPNPTPNPDIPGSYNKPDDRNNVGPRLGFALNVFGDGKTMLRGGYGMYFGRIINANVLQSYQNSGGPGSQVSFNTIFADAQKFNPSTNCAPTFPSTFSYNNLRECATSKLVSPNIGYLDSHLQNPQVHEADIALEQDMGHGVTFGITYMGSLGRELDSATDTNLTTANTEISNYIVNNTPIKPTLSGYVTYPHGGKAPPLPTGIVPVKVFTYKAVGTGNPLPFPKYGQVKIIRSNVNTNYNALAFQVNKRYNNGFWLESNFTWAHSLDYNPYIGTGIPSNNTLDPTDLRQEYGNSSLDIRRRFVLSLTYEPHTHFHGYKDQLFGGWRIAPIAQIQSGSPYTPYIVGYPAESTSGFRGSNGSGGTSGRIEELRRNQYNRPKTAKVDLRVGKNFYFNVNHAGLEKARLEVFAEAFNIANHQNITGIQNTAYRLSGVPDSSSATGFTDTLSLQPDFGTYNNANSNYTFSPRQVQLAILLHF